jgi:uncharacterized protein YkwD
MTRRIVLQIIIFFAAALLITAAFLYSPRIKDFFKRQIGPRVQEIEETALESRAKLEMELVEIKKPSEEVITPPPLRGDLKAPSVTLNKDSVLNWTNQYRKDAGLAGLMPNLVLDQAANKKMQDMFNQQYFEHINPQGLGPGDVLKSVSYQFIVVGENLALGNFAGDQALVDAWMASSGHRANILSVKFRDIGIAVGQGVFEGRAVWLAVQSFGTPVSYCPAPDPALLGSIEQGKTAIQKQDDLLKISQNEINILENQRASLYREAQTLIDEGERQIAEGNQKIKQGNEIYRQTGSRDEARKLWDEGAELQRQGQAKANQGIALQAETDSLNNQIKDKINAYNSLVGRIKIQSGEIQKLVTQYNSQVNAYNLCIEQFS